MLGENTIAVLNLLDHVDWFSAVGTASSNTKVKSITSWKMAMDYCQLQEWENAQWKGARGLGTILSEQAYARYQEWNRYIFAIKRIIEPMFERKTKQIIETHNLPKAFRDNVLWDMVTIAICTEYADIYLPLFYADLACWYVKGHFPCGWEGTYPEGRLIVF